ncbi:MAG: CBS domain-containing protein [Armatimonadota bacterium]
MKVKDVMRSPAITILEDATLREAVALLSASRVSGLPVVNISGKLVGIATEHDIIKNVMPTYGDIYTGDEALTMGTVLLENRVIEVRNNPIKSIMNPIVVTVDENDELLKAASIILLKKVKRLPVLRNDEIIGIISRIDVVQAAMQGLL